MQKSGHPQTSLAAEQLTNGGDGSHNLAKLQLIQNGGFTSSIESHLQGQQAGYQTILRLLEHLPWQQ